MNKVLSVQKINESQVAGSDGHDVVLTNETSVNSAPNGRSGAAIQVNSSTSADHNNLNEDDLAQIVSTNQPGSVSSSFADMFKDKTPKKIVKISEMRNE